MEFEWSAEQLEFKKAVVAFVEKEFKNDIVLRDKNSLFSKELWKKCADFGLLGAPIPEEYGGQGLDILTTLLMMEGFGYACPDNGLAFGMSAQIWDVQMPILKYGTEDQKKYYLPKLCNGDSIGAIAITEPDAGSDAFNLQTTAVREGNYYILNGTKTFITNGPIADIFLIFATVNKQLGFMGITVFIVERESPGFIVGKNIEKMGLKTNPWSEVIMNNCKVPVGNRLSKEGNGVSIFKDSMEWERSCILAAFIGRMEKILEESIKYVKERKQFNKPIGKFQSVSNKIVDMKLRLETARLLLYHAGWLKQNQKSIPLESALTKLYISEAWVDFCLDAIQIRGGYGYTTEFEVERELRDAVGSTLFAGTSEIQRNIIAQYLGL